MERVCIVGGCGTGKTTLANNLGKKLGLPICHLDGIHHLENWKIRDKKERDKIILEKANEEKWVIDGIYHSTLLKRFQRADYIIYLDYSTIAQLRGVFQRLKHNYGKERAEIPGCKEQMNWKFFWHVVFWRKNKRKIVMENLEKVDKEKIHIFKNRKQLNKWYEEQFNEKIEH